MKIDQRSRRSIRSAVFIGVLAGSVFSTSGAFAVDPTPINTQAELELIGSSDGARAGDYFLNFEGSELVLTTPTNSTYVTGIFTGTFDGNGKTLSGLAKPLFDVIGTNLNGAEISNLVLSTVSGTGVQGRGVLANDVFNSDIAEVSATGKVTSLSSADIGGLLGVAINTNIAQSSANVMIESTGENIGGLIGRIENSQIQNSIASGNVIGGSSLGGLIGKSNNSVIDTALSTGLVTSLKAPVSYATVFYCTSGECSSINIPTFTSQQNIGGLIGESSNSSILNSSSSGAVDGNINVGGLIGQSSLDALVATASSSPVTGRTVRIRQEMGFDPTSANNFLFFVDEVPQNIGGLIGNSSSEITNSYSTGSVIAPNGTYAGGLIGTSTGDVTNSYSSSTVNAISTVGGLVGKMNGDITNSYSTGTLVQGSYEGMSNRVGGLVGVLLGGSILNSFATAGGLSIIGVDSIGGLVGQVDAGSISGSYARISGDLKGLYGGYVGGLTGDSNGNISNSYADVAGDISGTGDYVGGLIASSTGTITNSYARVTGEISGEQFVGGLVGSSTNLIFNSFATGNVSGNWGVGGLVGNSAANIVNTYSSGTVNGGTFTGGLVGNSLASISNSYSLSSVNRRLGDSGNRIGGLVGVQSGGNITNSYATGGGFGILGTPDFVGSLVGFLDSGSIENSFSYIDGDVGGDFEFHASGENDGLTSLPLGGLVGFSTGTIMNSYGFVSGRSYPNANLILNSALYSVASDASCAYQANPEGNFALVFGDSGSCILGPSKLGNFPSVLSVVNTQIDEFSVTGFGHNPCFNSGNPYLLELENFYSGCVESGDTPPNSNRPPRERNEIKAREVKDSRTSEKIEKAIGFKYETPLPKSASISFVEATEKFELAKVKALEIASTANVKVAAKAGEALQISLKSESKEPVELWVKTPEGNWLLAGVITFDKDGKAILPPLQFKSAGDYSLVLNKPSADSAKGSEPLNQSGSVLVVVN